MGLDNYLTANDVAQKLNRDASYISRLCREGKVPGAEKKGSIWLIPLESIDKIILIGTGGNVEQAWKTKRAKKQAAKQAFLDSINQAIKASQNQ